MPLPTKPEELSHALLVAILMNAGGSLELPEDAFAVDALGGPDGSLHAVAMDPQSNGTMRISVQPRPDVDEGGVTLL